MTTKDTMQPEPGDDNYVHQLPAGIVLAMNAGRPELMKVVIRDIEEGKVKLGKKEVVEILKLVQGLLTDLIKLKGTHEQLEQAAQYALEQAQVAQDAAKSIVKTLQEVV